jgi:hypothetical protein
LQNDIEESKVTARNILEEGTKSEALHETERRYNEAEKPHQELYEARVKVLGSEYPSTLTSMANLASTYRNQGRWKEAEELEVRVMETSLSVLGEEHPDTLTSMNNLAFT